MNLTPKLLLFATFVLVMLLMSYNYRKRKKRIVCFGDSITEQGNRGSGYVKKLIGFLQMEGLSEKYEIIGSGIAGNKVTDLYERLAEDILSKGAEIVIIYIGINDVWHKLQNKGTDVASFTYTYEALIEKITAAGIKMLLCTPSLIGELNNHENLQDEDVERYAEIVRTIAEQYNLPLVDLRKSFLDYNLIHNTANVAEGILTTDGVHLNEAGNNLVAKEIWNLLAPEIAKV